MKGKVRPIVVSVKKELVCLSKPHVAIYIVIIVILSLSRKEILVGVVEHRFLNGVKCSDFYKTLVSRSILNCTLKNFRHNF